ncbi:glycosyltransferase [Synechococcus sp. BSF8S]|uniref:glycosyltransferase n=1 Tax=Synechococcales TaxID=1890424 RepID=UPI001628C822|nr:MULTISPECIES: glycosyltransferase [unclassified Synechococcus]MBC1262419.1 glycosyltransferase [Synechococcus sp. BSF8S]MBC1265321.1 glycosyltransferase [Synechococcus sp. BSA11S]
MTTNKPSISLVSTVFNDVDGIRSFFSFMAHQTQMPDEIVIVDAGSVDGTWELLRHEACFNPQPWRLLAIQAYKANVAQGRNLAIDTANSDIIVSTDIGCTWDSHWLEELVEPLKKTPTLDLVNGSWAVRKEDLEGPWAFTEWALRGDHCLEATAETHSSSRSIAYRKSCWEALGRYPEDLTLAADDAVFSCLTQMAKVPRIGAPSVRCWWHRHTTLKAFLKESFRYGLGDGEAAIRRKDFALTGGRIALEVLGLLIGLTFVYPITPLSPWLGILCLAVAGMSVGLKMLKVRAATSRLRAECVSYPLLRLLLFTYGTKINWLWGYFKGLQRGAVHCRDCRRRLKAMSPQRYHKQLDCQLHDF